MSTLMVPPHSIELEQSVLGAVLLVPRCLADVGDVLTCDDFYRSDHRMIFAELERMDAQAQPIDLVTLAESLKRSGQLEEIGGMAYLGGIVRDTSSAANVRSYAGRVRDLSLERDMLASTYQATSIIFEAAETGDKISRVQRLFAEIGGKAGEGPVSMKDSMPGWIDNMERLAEMGGDITGLPTGYVDLDKLTSGLQGGDLIIVAGRPSMGKTTLGMNLAEHCALKLDKPALVFSMEMSTDQLISRSVSSTKRVPLDLVRNPAQLREEDWPRVVAATTELRSSPLYIDDTPALSPMEMRARARRIKQRHGLGLIVVDYLQLMHIPGKKENRTGEISEISRSLKAMARELGVPVVALSQLNRSLEQRPNKRPIMSDLRESGAIEQDADLICFVYRDEVYTPVEDESDGRSGIAEIIIGKQRNGPLGTVHLTFQGRFCRFDNCEQGTQKRYQDIFKRAAEPRQASRKEEVFSGL